MATSIIFTLSAGASSNISNTLLEVKSISVESSVSRSSQTSGGDRWDMHIESYGHIKSGSDVGLHLNSLSA